MKRGLLLIDGSNVLHAANNTQPLKVGDQPTQAVYTFLRMLRPMLNTYSMLTAVVLWDGVSWRKMVFDEYKANRNKKPASRHEVKAQQMRDEYRSQLPIIKEALALLGVRQMEASNYEADDLAGMITTALSKADKRGIMISGDKDWIQLVAPTIAWVDPIRDYRLTYKTIPEKLGWSPAKKDIVVGKGNEIEGFVGVPSPQAWVQIKALMGDISDNIPGVGGIGPKNAIQLICDYGSVAGFHNQVIDKTIDVAKLPKVLRDLADSDEKQNIFARNMRLMDLRTKERPAAIGFKTNHGEYDPAKFEHFCRAWMFTSLLGDLDFWLQPFQPASLAEAA